MSKARTKRARSRREDVLSQKVVQMIYFGKSHRERKLALGFQLSLVTADRKFNSEKLVNPDQVTDENLHPTEVNF